MYLRVLKRLFIKKAFKAEDIVTCINNDFLEDYLTLGKKYKVIDVDEEGRVKINTNNSVFILDQSRFAKIKGKVSFSKGKE